MPDAQRQAHISYRMAYMMAPKRRSMYQLQEISAVRSDGKLQPVSIALSPISIDGEVLTIVSIHDNTAAVAARRKEREMYARLLQKQRLENLGLLSSGIAHDFRNLLSVVLGNAELATLVAGSSGAALAPHPQAIHGACARLQELSSRILRYAAGRIDIDSEPGRGSMFTLSFPLLANQAKAARLTAAYDRDVAMKVTDYFRSTRMRADRIGITDEWIQRVYRAPEYRKVQTDGRIQCWSRIPEAGQRYLRVVLLPDGETIHNAFFDRRFKP